MQPEKIDLKQIKLIHIAKGHLGMSDEAYRALLLDRYPGCFEGSCKELSYKEAEDLIEHFKTLGFEVKRKPRPKRPPSIPEVFNDNGPMAAKIRHLRADINWRFPDGYERFIKKMLKKDRITTRREAGKVIEALKAMKARQQCVTSGDSPGREASSKGAPCHRDGHVRGRGRVSW